MAQVGWQRVRGGESVVAGADLDGAVAAGGAGELLDRPAGAVLDEPGDGQGGQDDGQVGLDGVALEGQTGRARRSCPDSTIGASIGCVLEPRF